MTRALHRFGLLVVILLVLGSLPVSPVGASAQNVRIAPGAQRLDIDPSKLQLPPKPALHRLDATLNRVVERAAGRSAAAAAGEAPLSRGSAVAVSIRIAGASEPITAWLTGRNALIANTAKDVIEAYVPVGALADLETRPGVLAVSALVPPQAEVTSQGAAVHGAPNWNANGYTGGGIKVGIIDVGFIGYSSLIGSELPAPAAVRCYIFAGTYSTNLADCQTSTRHGTAVAETLIDVAPQVSLYLATPISQLDLRYSVLWMRQQGVQVINESLKWTWDGPGNGLTPFPDSPLVSVDLAAEGGITWVNSAGNEARQTWTAGYSDPDLDGFVDFYPGYETNQIFMVAGETIAIQARWDDSWTNASRDIDLYLFNSSLSSVVASSVQYQYGAFGQTPYERLVFTAGSTGYYYLALRRLGGSVPSWMQVQVWGAPTLNIYSTGRSIDNPSESANPSLLAVGAASWNTPDLIESYSSLGPTADGRTKPDLVGADCADTASYATGGFCGTSQATAHVAGLAALVRQRFPFLSASQVATYLRESAIPHGAPNNTWGYGFAFLPPIPPAPPTPTMTPTLTATPTMSPPSTATPTATPGQGASPPTATATPTSTTPAGPGPLPSATATATATLPPGGGGPAPNQGATTWYFAEGYTGAGFDEYLTIQNPNAQAADLTITYFLTGASPITRRMVVAGNSRYTVAVHDTAEGVGRDQAVSARVVSTNGVGIVVERPMYFRYGPGGAITGGHNVMGVQLPRQSWLFAEGYTGDGFDEYLTILNPNPAAAPITITYYLGSGQAPVLKGLTVPGNSRYTVAVHDSREGVGRGQAVSASVETSVAGGIIVERPMYFRYGASGAITGGHNVMGAAETRATWYFPNGNTTSDYDTYLTLMNPTGIDAQVALTYYIAGENTPTVTSIVVARNSRYTVEVHGTTGGGIGRGRQVGVKVESVNGVGLVAERPMYFRYSPAINGGHDVMGANQPARTWLFAEGYTGAGFDEQLVVLNPNATPAAVTLTYYLARGGPVVKQFVAPAFSRSAVAVHDSVLGVGRDQAVSAKVETDHPGGIVVERPMYFVYGAGIDGGHTVMGYVQ